MHPKFSWAAMLEKSQEYNIYIKKLPLKTAFLFHFPHKKLQVNCILIAIFAALLQKYYCMKNITEIDAKILELLQDDCSISYEQMSQIVGRSSTACLRRVQKLEKYGYIKARQARLNDSGLGFEVCAIYFVQLSQDVFDLDKKLNDICASRREIQQCFIINSKADFMIMTKFRTHVDYKNYSFNLIEIFDELEIREYESYLVVREICDRRTLPLST